GTYELVGKRKDGSRVLLEATAKTHNVGGQPGRVTALRDITDKRSLEDQFRQAQKMEAVGRLAGGVAHDFNNLLTIITSYSELLLSDLAPADPRRNDLDQIRQAAVAAAGLTRQLLAFSRQQVIAPRPIVVAEVVGNIHKMLERLIGEDIDLETHVGQEDSHVIMDPGQLEQIIMNLAVNARDAMPTGGKLTIETATVDLDALYVRSHWPATPGRFCMLAVSDTGCGMSDATRERIFEPFFTTKDPGKGTGLGLATVYGIVKQNHGFIWVYSELGVGTTFKIYLPVATEQPQALPTIPSSEQLPHGTETILLVEDAAAVRQVVIQILRHCGYTVLDVPDAKAAIEMAKRHPGIIDLLLTDVVMPGMSGRVLAERFATLRPEARVLYMSGYTEDAVVRHGMLTQGINYLQKPFSPATLARRVRQVIDR
ncbi:MAG: ATP-binding protein, partial [Gemmatimonadota bacterium]